MSTQVVIKKPKRKQIGLILFNTNLLSNDNMVLNMTNFFLKQNKYFVTIDREKKMDDEKQIIKYIKTNYDLKTDLSNIYYIGLRGNIMIYSIKIDDKKNINQGVLNDYSNNDYSWKTYFDFNLINDLNIYDNILKNDKYNLHLKYFFVSENKKQRISIKEIYSFFKTIQKNKII